MKVFEKAGWIVLFLVGLIIVPPALARLGETVVECHKRYGRPFSVNPRGEEVLCRYRKGGFDVEILFSLGRAEEVYYRRTSGALLSKADLDLFLKVNASTSSWVKVDQLVEWRKANKGYEKNEARQAALMRDLAAFFLWVREDGKAEASYDRELGVLLICDTRRLKKGKAEEAETERDENPLGF